MFALAIRPIVVVSRAIEKIAYTPSKPAQKKCRSGATDPSSWNVGQREVIQKRSFGEINDQWIISSKPTRTRPCCRRDGNSYDAHHGVAHAWRTLLALEIGDRDRLSICSDLPPPPCLLRCELDIAARRELPPCSAPHHPRTGSPLY